MWGDDRSAENNLWLVSHKHPSCPHRETLYAVPILFLSSHWCWGQISRKTIMLINTVGEILGAALFSPFPNSNLYLKGKTTFVFPISVSSPNLSHWTVLAFQTNVLNMNDLDSFEMPLFQQVCLWILSRFRILSFYSSQEYTFFL